MKFWIDSIHARDLDLALMYAFASDPSYAGIFLRKDTSGSKILSLSLNNDKEIRVADLTAILEIDGKRTALLIDDSVINMLKSGQINKLQSEGEKLVRDGIADSYFFCVIGPQNYIDQNQHLLSDITCISYEQIKARLTGNQLLDFMLKRAIEERKIAYSEKANRKLSNTGPNTMIMSSRNILT